MAFLSMTHKEVDRYDIIQRILRREINSTEAAKLLKISSRHVRRLKSKVKKHGAQGLIHSNRGKPSHNAIPLNIEPITAYSSQAK